MADHALRDAAGVRRRSDVHNFTALSRSAFRTTVKDESAIAAPAIGVDTVGGFINYVIVGFVWKTLMQAVMLPVTAAVIKWVKKREDYLPA